MDWFKSAVGATMNTWGGYKHIGDYKFNSYDIGEFVDSMSVLTVEHFGLADVPDKVSIFFLKRKDDSYEGTLQFRYYDKPPTVEIRFVIWNKKGSKMKPLLENSTRYTLNLPEIEELKGGESESMVMSVIPFLLHGENYVLAT